MRELGAGRTLGETEFIALHVLHHQARFILLIGREETQAPSAELFQSGRFGLERGDSFVAGQPGPNSYVEM